MFTTLVFWLLLLSHNPSRKERYHSFVLTFLEIVIGMEYLINIIYWSLLFDRQIVMDIWQPHTYRGPVINHLLPFLLLNTELILSGIVFNHTQNMRYYAYMFSAYGIINYLGCKYMGQPVYYFLPFNDIKTVLTITTILLLQTFVYISVATLNNQVLKKFLIVQESKFFKSE